MWKYSSFVHDRMKTAVTRHIIVLNGSRPIYITLPHLRIFSDRPTFIVVTGRISHEDEPSTPNRTRKERCAHRARFPR